MGALNMIRTINVTFEEKEFKALQKEKWKCAEEREQRLSWEDFILIKCVDKVI